MVGLQSLYLPFSPPTCKVVCCAWGAPSGQRVDGIDRRRGLGALIALCFLLVLFDRVLADEGAIFIELALATFTVVHQAVITLLLLDGAVQGCLAALQGLVVLIAGQRETQSGSHGWHSLNHVCVCAHVCVRVCMCGDGSGLPTNAGG